MKYSYSEAEIDDFKCYMRIVRRLPKENYLKLIDRWRKHSSAQERLLKKAMELLDPQSSFNTSFCSSVHLDFYFQVFKDKRDLLLKEIEKVLRKDMI